MREGWVCEELSNCIKLKSGDGLTAKKMIAGDFPVFGGNGIAGYHNKFNLEGENIIIGRVGAQCGNARFIDEKIWLTDNAFKVSEFKYDFDFQFLNYLLNYVDLRSYARQAAQPVISNSSLKNVKLCFPTSVEEQKQIVALLDKAFAAIDQAQANIERNIENAKELFQSKLNAIFSQKGEGWEEKSLGEVCNVLNGFAFKSKDAIPSSNTQLLRMGNLYQNILDLNRKPVFYPDSFAKEYNSYLLKEGDLIMSLTGTVDKTDYGYTVKIPSTDEKLLLNQRIMKIDIKNNDILNKDYLRHYLLSPDFLKRLYETASGTRQANLSSRTILTLTINFPSDVNIQREIVAMLEYLSRSIIDLEKYYQQKLDNLEDLKKSILQKAFSGELTQSVQEEELNAEQKHALLITLAYSRHRNAGTELTFGHTKSEKMIHLFENYANINLNRNPIKDAAGPNHFEKVVNVIEPLAKKEKYFSITKEDKRYTYGFAPNSFKGIKKLESQLNPLQRRKVEEIISLFLMENTEQSELFATVFAGWNNLILRGEEINDESIVYESRENWHPDKLKIDRSKFFDTITKLRVANIVPNGIGKLVDKKTLF